MGDFNLGIELYLFFLYFGIALFDLVVDGVTLAE
jgi:hypothetical protein